LVSDTDLVKKGHYIDGHEKTTTVAYQWEFVSHYLEYERQMFRQIQVPKKEAIKL